MALAGEANWNTLRELEPVTAAERKLVHARLEEHAGVVTASEGTEPHRRVVAELA